MKITQIKKIKRSLKKPHSDPPERCCCVSNEVDTAPCCGPRMVATGGEITDKVPGFISWMDFSTGKVPHISASLTIADHFGACMARWGFNRMRHIVPPGLYAIGAPGLDAPVCVTANYKMSYDTVRSALSGRNVWLLVLETFGVNVWCAAGKGTFGTNELVRRIAKTELHTVVNHRQLLLPILGAPGISAHEVAKRTGFSVCYAAIRADDLPRFIDNGMITTTDMRKVSFTTYERLVLLPVEIMLAVKSIALISTAVFLAALLADGYTAALMMVLAYLGAVLTGIVLVPLLLPWIPGRSFAVKGALAGVGWCTLLYYCAHGSSWSLPTTAASFLALPALCAFHALNFTGCTTFTSRSGVKKEMRVGIPIMGSAVIIGIMLLIMGRFL
ncbi:MAG: mercury methylation corrinoid protein HgcA [Desulfuromonadaceae bacterium]|nr:mercury methylation corrinoid protein HgcA [Desulfuromonadaceae bacterium]MDD5104413.1 mercury methylation corrinoid protein HgcA [Desulfuromonadaceae bacterium]